MKNVTAPGDMNEANSVSVTGVRLLIVDDELAARKVLATMLGDAGAQCKTAACAEEAMRILNAERLDAALVDLNMPGISGMELLSELRPRHPAVAFLMITGVDDIRVGTAPTHHAPSIRD